VIDLARSICEASANCVSACRALNLDMNVRLSLERFVWLCKETAAR